jgi:sigma-E factor negative regulatory protein RseA
MTKNIDDDVATGETAEMLISALMDGALAGRQADAALVAAMQPEGQARWQLYHLIGDTLRAADLAAHHDSALLAGVRAAMSQPALTLEPQQPPVTLPRQAANDGVFRWKLVAGFASVAAVAAIGWNVLGFASAPSPSGQQLARVPTVERPSVMRLAQPQASASAGLKTVAVAVASAAVPGAQSLEPGFGVDESQQMWRDPQLDRLLAAHRRMAAFGSGSPSAFLRSATFEEPQR